LIEISKITMTKARDNLEIAVHLDSQDLREGHDLYAVLHSALKSRTELQFVNAHSSQTFWGAEYFHLGNVSGFREASETEQTTILNACGRNILAESYYIEKCGMYFAAKMSLLAANTQERMLYSLFAADEAVHFNWMTNFISQESASRLLHNPFIKLIEEILQNEDRMTLAYVVQVILEGWGIHHYQALARGCLSEKLKKVFEAILKDEARHHGSGLVLFNEQKLSDAQIESIAAILIQFFRMVQAGPQMVVSEIEQAKGHLSKEQKTRVFAELNCEAETAKRLQILKSFIKSAAYADQIIASLERADALRPFTVAECAAV
jgi:rubrerythrin